MAINVTAKDMTLTTIQTYCRQKLAATTDPGARNALHDVIHECDTLMGYTGGRMPLEVPNQSKKGPRQ